MKPHPVTRTLLLAALLGCASNPPTRLTRVDREQRVTADEPARVGWFATLYSLQRELAMADTRRLEVLGALRTMLCFGADAPLDRVAAAAQARMTAAGIERAPTRLRRTALAEDAVRRWVTATTAGVDDAASLRALEEVEQALEIARGSGETTTPLTVTPTPAQAEQPRCDPHAEPGSQGLPGPVVLNQLAVLLRRSAAQGMMFQRTLQVASELRAQRAAVSNGAPAGLAAEFAAADRALLGVSARALMQQHESARTERWALGLLLPEGAVMPDDTSEPAPEEPP